MARGSILGLLALAAVLVLAPASHALEKPKACSGSPCWYPPAKLRWNYVLGAAPDLTIKAGMYGIDGFDTKKAVVKQIHSLSRRAVCYIDAGTWENWRPDAGQFPSSVLGKSNGWPGERWLDIRRLDVLGPIMRARMDMCQAKGFDGIDFDNVDGYANSTGFPLTYQDQLAYDTWLANRAHARGLTVALKNDLGQIGDLLPYFDYAVDEECFDYDECDLLKPFVSAGKAVFEVEYDLTLSDFCPDANSLGFNAIKKKVELDNPVKFCR
jgi:hypothetical protein